MMAAMAKAERPQRHLPSASERRTSLQRSREPAVFAASVETMVRAWVWQVQDPNEPAQPKQRALTKLRAMWLAANGFQAAYGIDGTEGVIHCDAQTSKRVFLAQLIEGETGPDCERQEMSVRIESVCAIFWMY